MIPAGQGGSARTKSVGCGASRVLSNAATGGRVPGGLNLARGAGRCALLFAFGSLAAFAADDSQVIFPGGSTAPAPVPSTVSGGTFNTVTLFLAVLLAIAGAWVYWRNRRSPGLSRGSTALAVEETKALGNRQYLVVASYEGKRFLLGVCPGKIDLLAPLGEREEPRS